MKNILFPLILVSCLLADHMPAQQLKSVVYDFDGFDLTETDLPEGDYSYGDLMYEIAASPLPAAGQTGDRVLKMSLAWNAGYGAFGRGIGRYLELEKKTDQLHFFFYNPVSNGQDAVVEVAIGDDDNLTGNYESASDDSWRKTITIAGKQGWQLISVPLSTLADDNTGGNGVFDISFKDGQLLIVELRFSKPAGTPADPVFYIDMICFSEGGLPKGSQATDLPAKKPGDRCLLGAHQQEKPGEYDKIPEHFEALFPAGAGRKIRYVNTYMQWATNGGTTPHMLPGTGYQNLIDKGYTPIITWEPMFSGHPLTDAVQPDLDEIAGGSFDTYIDAFADKLKAYTDTIIVRLMHEFDGDWYPWCIANNGGDPQKFITAYRHIVDRVKTKGASKVKWMWCPNNSFTPQEPWNRVTDAYPGAGYVDIVATDVYNSHSPQPIPWWRSFRWQTAEIYYYLTTHFPDKPFFICELACRERETSEPSGSQSKAGWIMAMDKELQSYFRKTRAIIFFSENKTEQWAVNSGTAALNSVRDNIWLDDYYFPLVTSVSENASKETPLVYPNPCTGQLTINPAYSGISTVTVRNAAGAFVTRSDILVPGRLDLSELPAGIYIVQLTSPDHGNTDRALVVKE